MTVISLQEDARGRATEALAALNVEVLVAPTRARHHLLDLRRAAALVRLIRRGRYHVLQTHLLYGNILGCAAGRLTGTPVVATLHGVDGTDNVVNRLKRGLETLVVRHGARQVMAVSAELAGKHQAVSRGQAVSTVLSPVASSDVSESRGVRVQARRLIGVDPEAPVLITVGHLSPLKGLTDLINAFFQLRNKHPNAVLLIVGRGELEAELKAGLRKQGLEHSVRLMGWR